MRMITLTKRQALNIRQALTYAIRDQEALADVYSHATDFESKKQVRDALKEVKRFQELRVCIKKQLQDL